MQALPFLRLPAVTLPVVTLTRVTLQFGIFDISSFLRRLVHFHFFNNTPKLLHLLSKNSRLFGRR